MRMKRESTHRAKEEGAGDYPAATKSAGAVAVAADASGVTMRARVQGI